MNAAIVLLLAFSQVSDANRAGQITAALGSVVIVREGAQYGAVARSGLQFGDEMTTTADGGSIFSVPGAMVYVGANSRLRFDQAGNATQLTLLAGEIRVVNSNPSLRLALPQHGLLLNRGAFRIQQTDSALRLASETGSLVVEAGGVRTTIAAGQEARISGGRVGQVTMLRSEGWTVDAARLQAEALAEEARRRRRIDTPDLGDQRGAEEDADAMRRPPGTQNQNAAASVSSGGAGSSASPGVFASAGLFADAQQSTNQGMNQSPPGGPFPGNIHLVTGESRYGLDGVQLNAQESTDIFGGGSPAYFSIGQGALPNSQVTTDFNTATNPTPHAVRVPGTNFYVLKLDQYGPIDAGLDPMGAENNNVGYAGLLGPNPSSPVINGATPLSDERAQFNENATFALGEIRLRPDGGTSNNSFELAIRRSDQDRLIEKDPNNNDANDLVTPNPQVDTFVDKVDPRFLPAAPTVKVPDVNAFDRNGAGTRFSSLNSMRRAAVTTVLADQLFDYAQRTGQTRFVVDGRIIDISGYRR